MESGRLFLLFITVNGLIKYTLNSLVKVGVLSSEYLEQYQKYCLYNYEWSN